MRDLTFTVPSFARVSDYAGAWMIEATAANVLLSVASRTDWAAHVAGAGVGVIRSAIEYVPAAGGTPDQPKQIAVVRLTGLLMKQTSSMAAGTSTVQARRDIRAAAADPSVSAILLILDSPGGTASGTSDLADDVKAAAAKKTVWAYCEDLCASAAYFVASQASAIYANSPMAMVGSIGTVLPLYDTSRQAASQGVEAVVFATGPHKGAGVAGAPITADQRQAIDDLIQQTQRGFDAAVAGGRKLTADQLAAVRTGQVWPADQAQALKLIDGVMPLDQVLAALAAASSQPTRPANGKSPAAQSVSTPTPGVTPMTFEQWLTAKGYTPAAVHGNLLAALQLAFEADRGATQAVAVVPLTTPAMTSFLPAAAPAQGVTGGAQVADPVADLRARFGAEYARVSAIQAAAAKYGTPAQLAQAAIAQGTEATAFELECLRSAYAGNRVAAANGGPTIVRGGGPLNTAAIEAALCMGAGLDAEAIAKTIPAAQREAAMNVASSREYRGFTLHQLMGAVIHQAGHSFGGSYKSDDFIQAAKDADRAIRQAGGGVGGAMMASGFATVSLPGILSNVANKTLIAAYTMVETAWQSFCAKRTMNDFKPHLQYRLDSIGSFRKVGSDGELKSIGLTEAAYTNKVDTYGMLLTLSRQMLVNDDLGAFLALPQMIARLGALRIEEMVFLLLLSNAGSFFSSGNRNLLTGASGALSIPGLNLAEETFSNQVDSNGKPILVSATRILVPTNLMVDASMLYKQSTVEAAGTTDRTVFTQNPHAGKFEPTKSQYLNNANVKDQDGQAFSGQSRTAYYLFADPGVRAAIGVGFLNGQETPTVREFETPPNYLGYQWQMFHDFGAAFEDPTAAEKVVGA